MIRSFDNLEVDSIDSGSILTNSIVSTSGINVTQLQGVDISTTAPSDGQVLAYNSGTTQWEPANNTISSGRLNGTYTLWVNNVTGNDLTGDGSSSLQYLTIARAITVFETVNYDVFHLMIVNTGVNYTYSETRTSQTVGTNTFTEFADFTPLDGKCSKLIIEGYTVPKTFTWGSKASYTPASPYNGPTWNTISAFDISLLPIPSYIMDTTTGKCYATYVFLSTPTTLRVITGNFSLPTSGTCQYWGTGDIVILNSGISPLYLTGIPTLEFRSIDLPNGFGVVGNNVAFRTCRVNLTNCYQTFDYLDIQGCSIRSSTSSKFSSGSIDSCVSTANSSFNNSSNLQISGFSFTHTIDMLKSSNISLFNGYATSRLVANDCTGLTTDSCYFTDTVTPIQIGRCSAVLILSTTSRVLSNDTINTLSISHSQAELDSFYPVTIGGSGSSALAAINIFCSVVNCINFRALITRRAFLVNGGSVLTWGSNVGSINVIASSLVDIINCSKVIYGVTTAVGAFSGPVFILTKNSTLISTSGAVANSYGGNVLKLGASAAKGWVTSNNAVYNNLASGNLAFTHATDEYCVVLG